MVSALEDPNVFIPLGVSLMAVAIALILFLLWLLCRPRDDGRTIAARCAAAVSAVVACTPQRFPDAATETAFREERKRRLIGPVGVVLVVFSVISLVVTVVDFFGVAHSQASDLLTNAALRLGLQNVLLLALAWYCRWRAPRHAARTVEAVLMAGAFVYVTCVVGGRAVGRALVRPDPGRWWTIEAHEGLDVQTDVDPASPTVGRLHWGDVVAVLAGPTLAAAGPPPARQVVRVKIAYEGRGFESGAFDRPRVSVRGWASQFDDGKGGSAVNVHPLRDYQGRIDQAASAMSNYEVCLVVMFFVVQIVNTRHAALLTAYTVALYAVLHVTAFSFYWWGGYVEVLKHVLEFSVFAVVVLTGFRQMDAQMRAGWALRRALERDVEATTDELRTEKARQEISPADRHCCGLRGAAFANHCTHSYSPETSFVAQLLLRFS